MPINLGFLQFCRLLFSLLIQFGLTLLLALFLYSFTTQLYTPQEETIKNDYFPFGWRLLQELDEGNVNRLKKAAGYLERARMGDFEPSPNRSTKISVTIVAANRQQRQFLTQTLGYLLHEIRGTKWPVLVCYVDEMGRDKEIERLSTLSIPFLPLYSNRTPPNLPRGPSPERLAKEANDYWLCLNESLGLMPSDYLLVLEDDALAVEGLARQLSLLVEMLDKKEGVDYVKLFHPWYLRKMPSYVQVVALCLTISFLPILCVQKWRFSPSHYLNAAALTALLTFLLVDKNQQLPSDLRFLLTNSPYLTYTESCCTQALLFRTSSVPLIVEQLSVKEAGAHSAKDHLIDESQFVGRMTDRNLFVHVGYFSAVRQFYVDLLF